MLSAESEAHDEELAVIARIEAATAEAEAAAAAGFNLEEGPLSTPEWSIDVDHDEGEAMIDSLEEEYEEWQE